MRSFAGAGSFTGLAQVGIVAQAGATLTLNGSSLQSAFAADPAGTLALITQAAQAFDNLSNNYNAPDGTVPLESQAVQQDVTNLQTIGGAVANASAVSQQEAAQQYQSALQLGFQARLTSSEVATLLQQGPSLATPQPFGSAQSFGLPFSSSTIA